MCAHAQPHTPPAPTIILTSSVGPLWFWPHYETAREVPQSEVTAEPRGGEHSFLGNKIMKEGRKGWPEKQDAQEEDFLTDYCICP